MSGGQKLGTVRIRKGIFQGDCLSPLLFMLALTPMFFVLREVKAGYLQNIYREKLVAFFSWMSESCTNRMKSSTS